MKKIVFITYSLCIGGAERRAAAIANYMAEKGFDVEILLLDRPEVMFPLDSRIKVSFIYDGSEKPEVFGNHPVEMIPYREKSGVRLADKFRLRLLKTIDPEQYAAFDQLLFLRERYGKHIYDFVVNRPDYTVISWMTCASLATMDALLKLPNEAVFVECTSPEAEFPKEHPINTLKRELYPRAQKAIFQTQDEADYYTFLPKCRKTVIPNPIFGDYPEPYTGKRRKTIVNFCHLVPKKNIPLLIDAFAMLHQEYDDYDLLIYGQGALKDQLYQQAARVGIRNHFNIVDHDVHVHEKIKDCAMFVSSSDHEGISNSMIEAMAIGLPVVCTDCDGGGARMMIQDHENGILVPKGDVQALYQGMKYMIDHPDEAEMMGRNASEIRERLNKNRIIGQWIEFLS